MSATHIKRTKTQASLPSIYESYLEWYAGMVTMHHVKVMRRVLNAFHRYLGQRHIDLRQLTIVHVDSFLAEYNAPYGYDAQKKRRGILRKFLRHLDLHCQILRRDLASLVVGRIHFAQSLPPKFLRPDEIKKLFASFDPSSSPRTLRQYAMLHLAYTLGLRPKEVSEIQLDDITFHKAEITLRARKAQNPIKLPLSDATIKAIAAYIMNARPKSTHRTLFLNLLEPHNPVSADTAGQDITQCMRKAGVPGSAYWLRHTYAQQLLEQGQSIFAIKELLGHDDIQSSERYLSIHTELMRQLLFHETL